jgi:hypothetical protein
MIKKRGTWNKAIYCDDLCICPKCLLNIIMYYFTNKLTVDTNKGANK